jgi:hypothetical protein
MTGPCLVALPGRRVRGRTDTMKVSTSMDVTVRSESWEAVGAFLDGLRAAINGVPVPFGLSVLDLHVNSAWVEKEKEGEEE